LTGAAFICCRGYEPVDRLRSLNPAKRLHNKKQKDSFEEESFVVGGYV